MTVSEEPVPWEEKQSLFSFIATVYGALIHPHDLADILDGHGIDQSIEDLCLCPRQLPDVGTADGLTVFTLLHDEIGEQGVSGGVAAQDRVETHGAAGGVTSLGQKLGRNRAGVALRVADVVCSGAAVLKVLSENREFE